MAKKKKISVQGLSISIATKNEKDYISLTDIAKQSDSEPRHIIQNWMKNNSTILYLYEWEKLHNSNLNRMQMHAVFEKNASNRFSMSPQKWIEMTNAVGLFVKPGRGGGTFAHKDIAINFCYWLSPVFQIYLIKEFQRLKEEEYSQKNLEWHISKITDNIDEVRNLLDTIPGQKEERNRLSGLEE